MKTTQILALVATVLTAVGGAYSGDPTLSAVLLGLAGVVGGVNVAIHRTTAFPPVVTWLAVAFVLAGAVSAGGAFAPYVPPLVGKVAAIIGVVVATVSESLFGFRPVGSSTVTGK